jgi:hypothetical protein
MSSYEKPRRKLLMILADPSIYIEISERIVREVRDPRVLQRRVITLPSKMLTMMLEARNTYFEVCRSPPFLDNLENMFVGSA